MSGKDDQKKPTENADTSNADATETATDEASSDASEASAIPEVEAEIVDEREIGVASTKDDPKPETIDTVAEEITSDESAVASTMGKVSPGIILVGVLGLFGLGVLGTQLLRSGDGKAPLVEAFEADPTANVDSDLVENAPDVTTGTVVTDQVDNAANDSANEGHSDAVRDSSDAAATDTIVDGNDALNDAAKSAAAQIAANKEAAEAIDLSANETPAIDPRAKVSDVAIVANDTDPRAAIAALQRLAKDRAAANDAPSSAHAAESDESTTFIADGSTEDDTVDGLEQSAMGESDPSTSDDGTVANTQTVSNDAGSAAAVAAPTGKIVNEIAELKEAVQQRTAALDEALSAEREKQAEDLASLRDELASALDERDRRSSEEIADLRNRIEKIQTGGLPAGRQAMAALALNTLQQKVATGGTYAEELEVLARLAPDAPVISAIRPFATTGVPTVSTLAEEFQLARRDAMKRANLEQANGWLDVMIANLKNLVSVRPATARDGDDVVSIISRAEAGLETGNIVRAVEETASLDGEALDAFSGWLAKAQNTSIALEAIREMNAALLNQFSESAATE